MDNPFEALVSGQADWDSDVIANFNVIERGYHVTERAGQAISSGQILTLNSGGFFFPYNPNSASVQPHALAYTAAASGDSLTALAWGIVRSLSITSAAVPGQMMFSNASGFLSAATLGLSVGVGLKGNGLLFNPAKASGGGAVGTLATLTDVNTNGVSNGKVLSWSDASSRWVPASAAAGASALAALTDVNTNGLSSGKALIWSDVSSRWVPSAVSGLVAGTPPTIVQVTFVQSGNSLTFVTTPSSGSLLVAMTFNPTAHTAATGWTTLIDQTNGTDFGDVIVKSLAAPGTLVQTPLAASDANNVMVCWELASPAGRYPQLINSATQQQATYTASGNCWTSVTYNSFNAIGLMATALYAGTVNSMVAQYNVNSDVWCNSGSRKLAAGHSDLSFPVAQQVIATVGSGGSYKGLVAIFGS